MANTETLNLKIKADVQQAIDHTAALAENLKRAGKEGKAAGKEISAGTQVADAGVNMIGGSVGGLGKAFLAAGAASKLSGKAMKAAMISSGIGIVVALVALLVEHWDSIASLMDGVSSESEKQLEAAKQTVALEQGKLETLGLQENALKLQGKSDKEIRDLKRQQVNEIISATEIQLVQQEEQKKAQVEAAKRNKDILKGLINFIMMPMMSILGMVDLLSEGLVKLGVIETATTLRDSLTDWTAELIFDPDQVEEDGQAAIDATKKTLEKLKSDRDGYLLADKRANEAATNSGKDYAQELADFKKKLAETTAQAEADTDEKKIERARKLHLAELDKMKVDGAEKAKLKAEIDKLYDDQLTEIQIQREKDSAEVMSALKEENALAEIELERTKAQEILRIQYDKDQLALEGMENQAALEKELEDKFLREKQEITDEYDKQDLEKAKKLTAAKVEMLQQGLSVIQSMMDLQSTQIEKDYSNEMKMAEKNGQDTEKIEAKFEKKRRDQAKKMKAMKIAMALVDTYQSAVSAYSAALQMGLPGLALAPVSAGLAIAAGLANVAMIEKQPLGGSGGSSGGGGGGGGGSPAPEMMSGSFQLGGGKEVEPARAYVVSDDITNNQNKLATIRRRATI
jgi:hypothetical protein